MLSLQSVFCTSLDCLPSDLLLPEKIKLYLVIFLWHATLHNPNWQIIQEKFSLFLWPWHVALISTRGDSEIELGEERLAMAVILSLLSHQLFRPCSVEEHW